MEVSRRSFFKRGFLVGTGGVAAALTGKAIAAPAKKAPYKLQNVQEVTNICCYCSGGCGTICSSRNGELINLEGDPDHPVNLGGLCPKGAAMWGLRNVVNPDRTTSRHPDRVIYPMVRRPGSDKWERISWEQAVKEIARHVKKTRDASFVEREDGVTVNRCDGIASLGAAQLGNEEAWLVQKFARSLGVVAIDNQTRVCHSSTVSGLAPTFGRGSMTSHWCDFANSDVIHDDRLEQRRKPPAELRAGWNAPRTRGATWIVVDPRYSRSAAQADIYGRSAPGHRYRVLRRADQLHPARTSSGTRTTCSATRTRPDLHSRGLRSSIPVTGLFSGWDPEKKKYSAATWGYDVDSQRQWDTREGSPFAWVNKPGTPKFKTPALKVLKTR